MRAGSGDPRGLNRTWLLAWLGGPLIGIVNGVARERTYGGRLDERTAHQLSSLAAILAFGAYFRWLQRRWPIATDREASQIGAVWLGLTICFEFGFGRTVARQSWRELLADYNLARGRTWPLVLAWIAIGPAVSRRSLGTGYSGR